MNVQKMHVKESSTKMDTLEGRSELLTSEFHFQVWSLFKNSLKSIYNFRKLLASDFQRSPQLICYEKTFVFSDCPGLHSSVISSAPIDDNA